MSFLTLRVRYPSGQGVLKNIDSAITIDKLILDSFETFGIDKALSSSLKILSGFPPKPLDLSNKQLSVGSLGIKSGDLLIYQIDSGTTASAMVSSPANQSTNHVSEDKQTGPVFGVNTSVIERQKEKSSNLQSQSSQNSVNSPKRKYNGETSEPNKDLKLDESGIQLERQVVPADNSCLFTSINFCMCGEVVDSEHTTFMREIIATVVISQPEKYSEPILGRPNSKYSAWIQSKNAWGGAIELQILAEYFQTVISVVDTQSGCLTKFGETGNFEQMMLLIYDGIHYDPLFQLRPTRKTMFAASNTRVLASAKLLAEEQKEAHNYTDTAGFTLKCLVCGHKMKGEKEAQVHAKTTKHINFSEV